MGKAARALFKSATPVTPSQATFEKLQTKYPPPTEIFYCLPEVVQESFKLSAEEICDALIKAPRKASPGIDGVKFEHFNALLGFGKSKTAKSFAQFCNTVTSGRLHKDFYTFISSANLIALDKGAGDVRPIAMGSTLRKIINRAALRQFLLQIKELMCPSQLGIAVSGGTEMINHIFECLLSDDPSLTALKTDFKNAFNMVSREHILDEIEELFPQLL